MKTQHEKARLFRDLHHRRNAFIIPNPWDIGSTRILAALGFEALATTSAGFAHSIGRKDNTVDRDRVLAHARQIAAATDLPVSADLENGFGADPETVAETIRLAAETGIAGGSIEDATGHHGEPLYEIELAADRIRAAVETVRSLPFPFTLTARAENFIVGRPDIDDVIRRLRAYQEAGADVLFAPGLKTRDEIAAVAGSIDRPLSVLAGLPGMTLSLDDYSMIGVRRISLGSALSRTAYGALISAGREMLDQGTFSFVDRAAPTQLIETLLGNPPD